MSKKTPTKKVKKAVVGKAPKAPKTPKKPKKEVTRVENDNFIVSLLGIGDPIVSEGATLAEAIMGLDVGVIKTKITLHVEYKGKFAERFLFVPQARRIFRNQMAVESFAKSFGFLLK